MHAQRTALVTGAAGGLGTAWVRKLVSEDYHVYLTARNIIKAEEAAINAGFATTQVTPLGLDVTNEKHMEAAARIIGVQFGRLDILVNNAGYNAKDLGDDAVFQSSFNLDVLDPEEVLKSYRINSVGPVLMLKHFRSLLGVGKDKKAISIGSWLGSVSVKERGGLYGYSGSKQALVMLNKAAALELAEDGIASVVVNPGWVATRMGGQKAPMQPVESVENMYNNVVVPMHDLEVGGFYNHDGAIHAL